MKQTSCTRTILETPSRSIEPLSPAQEERKRTMQTTVAIREEDPHRFKICPLKKVPIEHRPAASPSLNFDRTRPYVGCRLELPTLYQLAPSRTASTYSFNSINSALSEAGSVQVCTLRRTSEL